MIENVKLLLSGMSKHPKIFKNLFKIKGEVYKKICDLEVNAVATDEPVSKEKLSEYTEIPIKKGYEWAKEKFGACWFHIKGEVPEKYDCSDKKLVVLMNIGGEGLAYDGENTVDIITPILSITDVFQAPTAGKRVLNVVKDGKVDAYVDCGYNGYSGKFLTKAIFKYAYIAEKDEEKCDYYYDYLALALLLAAFGESERLEKSKGKLVAVLKESYGKFSCGDTVAAKEILKVWYDKKQDYESVKYTMIGQAHLDLAWLWPKRESKRKAVRTYTNAVSLIEKYPFYVFGASQAQALEWVKESAPTLFERIKKCVADGNIELQGGMWVESDCNMPCGESLIRQFYYGDRFFTENFGKTSDVVWLPDAFGFPYTFPQIIKGVGKKYFVTIKLNWNNINKFPYQSFYWSAPDGSRVLGHISPEGTYYNDGTPVAVAKAEQRNIQKEVGNGLIIYGPGDGGGGPGEAHTEVVSRINSLYGAPKTEAGSAQSFFDEIKDKELPVYDGELYLERHQGTLTSQSNNKLLNRRAERALHTAEWLSALTEPVDMDELWKTLLFTQFHDVLPGSGIERVHTESCEELKTVISKAEKIIESKLSVLSDGKGLYAVNPSPFCRDEILNIGKESYRFKVNGYSSAEAERTEINLVVGKNTLENDKIKVVFEDGIIISYIDKENNAEINSKGLNKLVIFKDKKTKYNAWDIDPNYEKYPSYPELTSFKTYKEGAFAVAEAEYKYGKSTIRQEITLSDGTTVRIDNKIDWHESHKMLRAEFYPSFYGDYAECDIQFGHIDRSTRENNDIERAQFEVCAHKYVSVKGEKGIFAVYSDSKYGYRIKNGKISVNLLRSPKYPDENCDMGEHEFSYAFDFAYDGKEIVKRAYNFSYPLIITENEVKIGPIVTADTDNIIIETVKPSKDGGIAVRMYERFGKETETSLTVNKSGKLYLSDILENNLTETENIIKFRPYEIKTLLIKEVHK